MSRCPATTGVPPIPVVPLNIARGAGQLILYQRCSDAGRYQVSAATCYDTLHLQIILQQWAVTDAGPGQGCDTMAGGHNIYMFEVGKLWIFAIKAIYL